MNFRFTKFAALLTCCLLPATQAQSSQDLIADDALIVLKAKNYNSLKNLFPPALQGQMAMGEMMFQAYDFNKEVQLVVSSIMPPSIYVAAPLKEGSDIKTATATLPPAIQAQVQSKGSYVLIPLQGALPTAFGKSKLKLSDKSTLHLTADIKSLNAKQGPFLSMMLQQGLNQITANMPQEQDSDALKSMLNIYSDLLNVLLTNTENLDITVDKSDKISINNKVSFLAGNTLAQTCQNFEQSTLPAVTGLTGDFLYSSHFDYNKIAFKDELKKASLKYAKTFKADNAEALINEFVSSFQAMGAMNMIGSMSMKMDEKGMPSDMDQEIITFSPKAKAMIDLYEKMNSLMKDWNFAGTKTESQFAKADFKVENQDVYSYKMKTTMDAIDMVQDYNYHLSADTKALYLTSNGKEGLTKLMQQKEQTTSNPGVFWMKADYGSMFDSMPTAMPFEIPPVEMTLKTKGNSANFNISF